jgi:gliding motility-associated-like protein
VVVNQQAYICQGESYLFNGIDYSNEGVYFDSTNTILGCDSINVLSLFIKEDYQTYLFDTICLGSNYYFAYDSLSNSGTYTWPLLSDNGCDSTIVLNLYVDNCDEITLYAPNSFTPDGDGLNDLWYPIIRNSKSLTYSIYNRWGEKILDSSELPWDGKYNGIDCPIGVYTYVINYTDNSNLANQINGYISLIR